MKSHIYLLFIICWLSSACSKTVFELEGKVVDADTKTTVPYRRILVEELVPENNTMITFKSDEFLTDSAGRFTYSLRRTKTSYLYNFYVVGDSDYAYSSNRLGLSDLYKYGRYLTFYVNKLTDFTIAIEKKADTSFQDTLYLNWKSNGVDGRLLYPYKITNYYGHYGNSSDIEFRWIGGNIKSSIKTKVYADKETVINWELFRNGENSRISDTIICMRDVNNYTLFSY